MRIDSRDALSLLVSCLLLAGAARGSDKSSGLQVREAGLDDSLSAPRIGVSAGMAVNYINLPDIVNLINTSGLVLERVPDFKGAAEFFGAVSFPLSMDWVLKIQYAYLLGSFSPLSQFGSSEYEFTLHMPDVIVQYLFFHERTYNLKGGIGGGYYVGALTRNVGPVNDRFSGKGPGLMAELEGNTALGEDLFAHLGLFLRWGFVGELTNDSGLSPGGIQEIPPPTLHFFGAGAKLGFTYYF